MNGTLSNWLKHAIIALIVAWVFGAIFSLAAGCVVATAWYWRSEAGEKSKQLKGRPEGWRAAISDMNPFDRRWVKDDRLDLAFPLGAVWGMFLLWKVFG